MLEFESHFNIQRKKLYFYNNIVKKILINFQFFGILEFPKFNKNHIKNCPFGVQKFLINY